MTRAWFVVPDLKNKMNVKGKEGFRPKKRKNKLVLVFDENARREFLTGFRKRKLQRKNKAKEEFEQQLKLERKRIKSEAREAYKKLLLSQKTIPDIDLHTEEIDMGTHSVSVKELSAAELAKGNNWIGTNEVQYEERKDGTDGERNCDESQNDFELEGMEMKSTKRNKKKLNSQDSIKNCKDIKKVIKKQAALNVKNSKIFKKKAKIEKIKNIKQHRRQERKRKKLSKKGKRAKNKNN